MWISNYRSPEAVDWLTSYHCIGSVSEKEAFTRCVVNVYRLACRYEECVANLSIRIMVMRMMPGSQVLFVRMSKMKKRAVLSCFSRISRVVVVVLLVMIHASSHVFLRGPVAAVRGPGAMTTTSSVRIGISCFRPAVSIILQYQKPRFHPQVAKLLLIVKKTLGDRGCSRLPGVIPH